MNKIEKELSFLLSRLTWPSGVIRERACIAIADLFADPKWTSEVQKSLLAWISAQTLESIASIGLIIFLYIKTDDADSEISTREEIKGAITKPSLLSNMIVKELFPEDIAPNTTEVMNSGRFPDEFQINSFFVKYSRNFLPPIYMDMIKRIELAKGVPLIKQWAFEWTRILDSEGKAPSAETLNFFYENEYSDYTVVRDTFISEVYRSSYLRTLSWAITSEAISEAEGDFLAIRICPIDLGLWFLKSNLRPEWWPMLSTATESIDIPAQIWDLTNTIWSGQKASMNDWIIAQASGYVYKEHILYDLEIDGFFKINSEENNFNLELLSNKYRSTNKINFDPFTTGLKFQGIIESRSIDSFRAQFDNLIPASCYVDTHTIPRWQFWRMYRQIWFPNSCIIPCMLVFKCSKNSIIVYDGEEIIGKWIDWRDILQEKATANLPPLTGQYLQIKRDKVDEFLQENDLTFCWICRLNKYHREHDYREYTISSDYRLFG
jgi:hypothetical protein